MFQNFNNFKVEVFENGKSIDLIGLCETHLTEDKEKIYALEHYNFFSTNIASNKGGVCIYVKDSIPCRLRSDLCRNSEHLEAVFVECLFQNKKLMVGMIYHRPGTNVNRFLEDISDLLENITCDCILMGDYNFNILNEANDNNVSNFVSVLREYFYHPVVTKPTRVHNRSVSLLDQIWINFGHESEHSSYIIFNGITDHFPVIYQHRLNSSTKQYKLITYRISGD